MDNSERSTSPPPPPPQTIVIDRRERGGILRRLILPLLLVFLFFSIFGNMFVQQAGYPTLLPERYVAGDLVASKVAVVDVSGLLMGEQINHILAQVRQARDDKQVRAIVLRIDSPGGSISGADQIWRELSLIDKPIVASMADVAASGGYYVACPADLVLAEPTTLTGSIGVIWESPQVGELLDKLGVKMQTVTSGEWKDSGSIFHKELTTAERERLQQLVETAHQRFVSVVAQGRKMTLEQAGAVANGKVLTANEALSLKLIDRLGYQDDAIREAWNLARMESSRVVRYGRPFSLSSSLLDVVRSAPSPSLSIESILWENRPRMLYLAR